MSKLERLARGIEILSYHYIKWVQTENNEDGRMIYVRIINNTEKYFDGHSSLLSLGWEVCGDVWKLNLSE